MLAPELTTDRLRLRAHRADDLGACFSLWGDADVVRHIGNASTEQETWFRVLRYGGMWALLGHGYWVFEERATGRYIGEGGFADFHRTIEPPITGPEAGWALLPAYHGQGYATEAMLAAHRWADEVLARDTFCIIAPQNAASIAVARRCGYAPYAETTFRDAPTKMFRRSV